MAEEKTLSVEEKRELLKTIYIPGEHTAGDIDFDKMSAQKIESIYDSIIDGCLPTMKYVSTVMGVTGITSTNFFDVNFETDTNAKYQQDYPEAKMLARSIRSTVLEDKESEYAKVVQKNHDTLFTQHDHVNWKDYLYIYMAEKIFLRTQGLIDSIGFGEVLSDQDIIPAVVQRNSVLYSDSKFTNDASTQSLAQYRDASHDYEDMGDYVRNICSAYGKDPLNKSKSDVYTLATVYDEILGEELAGVNVSDLDKNSIKWLANTFALQAISREKKVVYQAKDILAKHIIELEKSNPVQHPSSLAVSSKNDRLYSKNNKAYYQTMLDIYSTAYRLASKVLKATYGLETDASDWTLASRVADRLGCQVEITPETTFLDIINDAYSVEKHYVNIAKILNTKQADVSPEEVLEPIEPEIVTGDETTEDESEPVVVIDDPIEDHIEGEVEEVKPSEPEPIVEPEPEKIVPIEDQPKQSKPKKSKTLTQKATEKNTMSKQTTNAKSASEQDQLILNILEGYFNELNNCYAQINDQYKKFNNGTCTDKNSVLSLYRWLSTDVDEMIEPMSAVSKVYISDRKPLEVAIARGRVCEYIDGSAVSKNKEINEIVRYINAQINQIKSKSDTIRRVLDTNKKMRDVETDMIVDAHSESAHKVAMAQANSQIKQNNSKASHIDLTTRETTQDNAKDDEMYSTLKEFKRQELEKDFKSALAKIESLNDDRRSYISEYDSNKLFEELLKKIEDKDNTL